MVSCLTLGNLCLPFPGLLAPKRTWNVGGSDHGQDLLEEELTSGSLTSFGLSLGTKT